MGERDDGEVWFITGGSSGIGAALAAQVLAAGHRVVATFRSGEQAAAFTGSEPGRSFGAVADVRDRILVEAAVERAVGAAGRIDVVVNNAGYALVGAVEEVSDAEMLDQLDVDFLGVHRVIRAVLPTLRAQGSGCIVNVSSVAGQVGAAGLGAYDAAKAAVELLSEALAAEVGPLGIRVLIVEPGNIRTDWAGRSMVQAAARIDAYDATAGATRSFFGQLDGHQDGDPDVVAAAIRAAVADPGAPLRVVIGADAHQWIADKLDVELADLARWTPSTGQG